MKKFLVIVLSMFFVNGVAPASAAIVTDTIEVRAKDFVQFMPNGPATPPPFEEVTFRFSLTFDNSSDIEQTNDGITVLENTLPYATNFAYASDFDVLSIGTNPSPSGCSATNMGGNFCFFMFGFSSGNPNVNVFTYSDGNNLFDSFTVSVSRVAAVPEPSTWFLMIFGFGLIGLSMRRRNALKGGRDFRYAS